MTLIRHVSDTARWVAVFRARETERPDALFRDPYAAALAGEEGRRMHAAMDGDRHAWSFVARTWRVDRLIEERIAAGTSLVLNLAAGLDARPYRMDLPPDLQWVEVDLPEMIAWKETVLGPHRPRCRLERVALDLSDVAARRELFQRLNRQARNITVVTEGLMVYLTEQAAGMLADDLAASAHVRFWITDLITPGLLRMLARTWGNRMALTPLRFAPAEGLDFFRRHGWRPAEAHSTLRTARRLGRLSPGMRLASYLPDGNGRRPDRPWGGVLLLEQEEGESDHRAASGPGRHGQGEQQ